MNYSGNSLSFVLRLFFLSFFLICVPAFGDDGAESVNARGSFEERYGSYGDFYSPEDSENLSHVYYEYGTPATKWTVLVYMSGSKMESSYGEGSGVLLKMASSCANPTAAFSEDDASTCAGASSSGRFSCSSCADAG